MKESYASPAMFSELARLQFKRVHRGRSDNDCHIYERQVDDQVTLIVQLWSDGNHRASYMAGGRCDKYPSGFSTHLSLANAVDAQLALAKYSLLHRNEPRTVPREWMQAYRNHLFSELNLAAMKGAQALGPDVAAARQRLAQVDAWLDGTTQPPPVDQDEAYELVAQAFDVMLAHAERHNRKAERDNSDHWAASHRARADRSDKWVDRACVWLKSVETVRSSSTKSAVQS